MKFNFNIHFEILILFVLLVFVLMFFDYLVIYLEGVHTGHIIAFSLYYILIVSVHTYGLFLAFA